MTTPPPAPDIERALTRTWRAEAGALHGTLLRLTGDLALAQDALQDAAESALRTWPDTGVPQNPAAWLATTARRKAIDRMRRATTRAAKADDLRRLADLRDPPAPPLVDDQLPLLFACCHPALGPDAQVALTLRTVCGLTTPEIARAFLVPRPTLAQRLVRARRALRGQRFPLPDAAELPARLDAVLTTIYLVFNEGYAATAGDDHIRRELCAEALRLARLTRALLPDEPEIDGLLALMLLHDARRDARLAPDGSLVLLSEQDRTRWRRPAIDEGLALIRAALERRRPGPYQIQAAIAALHAEAAHPDATDWAQIEALYERLHRHRPDPVVALNHAVAVAMHQGPAAALPLVDALAADGALDHYPYLPATRADLLRRLDRRADAAAAYRRALELTHNAAERRYLKRRLAEVTDGL
ncbi:MAG: DUF6596 domain-containing protein [bacterium]